MQLWDCDSWWHHHVREGLHSKGLTSMYPSSKRTSLLELTNTIFSLIDFLRFIPNHKWFIIDWNRGKKNRKRKKICYFQLDISVLHLWHVDEYHRQSFLMHSLVHIWNVFIHNTCLYCVYWKIPEIALKIYFLWSILTLFQGETRYSRRRGRASYYISIKDYKNLL